MTNVQVPDLVLTFSLAAGSKDVSQLLADVTIALGVGRVFSVKSAFGSFGDSLTSCKYSAGSGGSSSVFGAFKGFAGVTSTPAVDPTEVGASPFLLLSGIAKSANGTAATTSALETSIFATTDPSKVFSGVGSSPKEDTAGSAGKDTGDESMRRTRRRSLDFGEAAPTPFSFGFGSTSSTPRTDFIFANVAKPTEDSKPFTPVKEMDSIFSKRFNLFVKADGNYSDRDIGTQKGGRKGTGLGAGRHQHRPDSAQHHSERGGPVQGMGKNNVIMVCVPTPETKPPSVLLLVKTDDLYETLNKNKPK
ncbi:nucleoporin [Culex quinquefasciatus]|uniref:Nucleoporin n=1 Tax=Culex quinquefasciatus TaxID=7176 RepID=B0XBL5_CULQU|nr:nucleoporin [Culex quinquefasciatus]|eukprot:XP_001867037.1 nucleoporin [Culex quinquefasciatus]